MEEWLEKPAIHAGGFYFPAYRTMLTRDLRKTIPRCCCFSFRVRSQRPYKVL